MDVVANWRPLSSLGVGSKILLWLFPFFLLLWGTRALILALQMVVLHKKALKSWARLRLLLRQEAKIGENILRRVNQYLLVPSLPAQRLRTVLDQIPRAMSPLECSQLYSRMNKNLQRLIQILEESEDPQLIRSLQEVHQEWLNLQRNVRRVSKTYNQCIARYNKLRLSIPLRWILLPLGIPPLEYFPIEEEFFEVTSVPV